MKESDRKAVIENYRQIMIPVEVDSKEVEKAWDSLRQRQGGFYDR